MLAATATPAPLATWLLATGRWTRPRSAPPSLPPARSRPAQACIGNIAFGDNGKYAVNKIERPSGATRFYSYPVKPGYVMIADCFKKQNQLGMKLVKRNI